MESLSVESFFHKLKEKNTILLDVRTDAERIELWIIPWTSLMIDVYDPNTAQKLAKLDINASYAIYCAHGVRSRAVMQHLVSLWCKDVCDLEWWREAYVLSWWTVVAYT